MRNLGKLGIVFDALAQELRPIWRRDFAINVVLGGLYTPIAKRRATRFLVEHTVVDGTPLQVVAAKKSPWPALMLVVLFLALRIAGEFGHGPPLPLVILGGVLLLPYLWGTVTSRSVASVQWREWQPRFVASWREVYAASWPLLTLGIAWALAEPAVSAAAARAGGELDANWIVGVLLAVTVSFPLLVRLGFNWKRLRLERTEVAGHALQWPATYVGYLRIWAATVAAILVCGVLPVVLLRYALLGSFTVSGLEPKTATVATLAGIVLVLLLTTPIRARHEARMFMLGWNGLRAGDAARVTCVLNVRAFAALRTRLAWRSLVTLGRARPQAIVETWRAKVDSLMVEAAM